MCSRGMWPEGQYNGDSIYPNCKADSCCYIPITQQRIKITTTTIFHAKLLTLLLGPSTAPIFYIKRHKEALGYGDSSYILTVCMLLPQEEILCIAAAEIGENTGLQLFGFNVWGIIIAYAYLTRSIKNIYRLFFFDLLVLFLCIISFCSCQSGFMSYFFGTCFLPPCSTNRYIIFRKESNQIQIVSLVTAISNRVLK